MQWTRRRRFQKCKSTVTVRTVHCLQGMAWCPKPTPSAAGEALQCRAGGAPVRRSEEIRWRSNALDFPDVRICQTYTQSATNRSNRSNELQETPQVFQPLRNKQPARRTGFQKGKSTPTSPDSVRPQGMLSVPQTIPSDVSHAVDAHEALPKR